MPIPDSFRRPAFRIGQDKAVMVDHLVSGVTIQETVVALQEYKLALLDLLVEDGGLLAAPLTTDDIRWMLGACGTRGC